MDESAFFKHIHSLIRVEGNIQDKTQNCHSFALAMINQVLHQKYGMEIAEVPIPDSFTQLVSLINANRSSQLDYNAAIDVLPYRLISFHTYSVEGLDHSGIIAPADFQISRLPRFDDCLVFEREASTSFVTRRIREGKYDFGDGVALKKLPNAVEFYRQFPGFNVAYYPWG